MEEQPDLLQWYTRRAGVIRGPFTAEIISRHLLLGRIRLEDELSRDCEIWSVAGQVTRLLPEQLQHLDSQDDYRQLIVAHLQADERQGERRCRDCKNRDSCRERRILTDRRQSNSSIPVAFQYHTKTTHSQAPRQAHLRTVLLALLLAGMLFAWLMPTQR